MWTKICGLTSLENALQVADLQPDAIGLNFYPKSKRCVEIEIAQKIVDSLPADVLPVGLFVNHSIEQIREICGTCGINTIQLHGDETVEFASQLYEFQIIRAVRVDESTIANLGAEVQSYSDHGIKLFGVLIDARVGDSYGGTGQTAPWELIANHYDKTNWPPLILAGGLEIENVEAAMQSVSPWGVDVASGVESAPGMKNPKLVAQFLSNARAS